MSAPGRYYRVSPEFWTDHRWDDDTRLAGLYILTCPHRTTEGIFRLPLDYAASDLAWTVKRFRKAFERLRADGFIEYDDDAQVCLIVKALRWQAPTNPNQVKAAMKALSSLPPTPLLDRFGSLAERHAERLSDEFRHVFGVASQNGSKVHP